ncbi:MAG: glycoside hydrolase family 127 protein [Chitinophagia bacterium]|nr:glycoside hydrolase family 127 protein [Chitinophagia bacterium]
MAFRAALAISTTLAIPLGQTIAQTGLRKLQPVSFSQVEVTDAFWKPKIDKVATKTLEACIQQTELKTGRIRNFEKVARGKGEKHEGIFYDDSDVFKALEAMAYSLKTHPSSDMERKCDEWIDKIAAAQQPDGYLNTFYTLTGLEKRYSDMSMHEDYNNGHLIEAAVAYFNATGKRKLLDVAIRWADHFDSIFGPGKRHWVTGHQELELALVKLFRTTSDRRYLKLADWLLSERGHGHAKGYTWTDWKDTAYAQDAVPVKDQREITGHAVRAMYLYTGAADVAAETGDADYLTAMRRVWEDVVFRNMYVTGGIGSAGSNEGFTRDYDLPNEQAYCETCASVGMVFWNHRMNGLTGRSEYIDILERSLYNGALDGLSLSGDRFFYGNPLASRGQHQRREWFGTACCPSNIARLVASLGDYVYATTPEGIAVNLFVGSRTAFTRGGVRIGVQMETGYPWDGRVALTLDPAEKSRFKLAVRIPGWLTGKPVPGDLYTPASGQSAGPAPVFRVNGKPVAHTLQDGYALIENTWKKGDRVEWAFEMPVTRLVSRDELKPNQGRVAIQRGPLVYCVEGTDNEGHAWNLVVPENTAFDTASLHIADERVTTVTANVPVLTIAPDGQSAQTEIRRMTAIPYYAWANRGKTEMQVWLPTAIREIKINY